MNATSEEKNQTLKALFEGVCNEVKLVVSNSRALEPTITDSMPWNIAKAFCQLSDLAERYLADVMQFVNGKGMVSDKILSFHLNQVKCFTKGKPAKKYQFGRMFQIGRIKGNFLFTAKADQPDMPDKKSVSLMIDSHHDTFGKVDIQSVGTDKGYYSIKNEKLLHERGVKEIGIQRPDNIKRERISPLPKYREEELINRRSGIEPLIGHAKQSGQLGRSRMKSDATVEASGFASVLAFNLKQMVRHKTGKISLEAT